MKKIVIGIVVIMVMQTVSAEMVKVYPSDDAYTNSWNTGTNYGASDTLNVGYDDNFGRYKSYLKFNINGVGISGLDSAVFSVDPATSFDTNPPRVNIYSMTDSWSEGDIRWSNAPSEGSLLGYFDNINVHRLYFDIISLIPDGYLSFALVSNNLADTESYVKFYSKDVSESEFYGPYLLFDYGPNDQYPVINEFTPVTLEDEFPWVEFYNPRSQAYNLEGCELYDGNALMGILDVTVPARGFAYHNLTRQDGTPLDWLDDEGDRVLLECGNIILDQVIYGEADPLWDPDGSSNNAPTAGLGESVGRDPDGLDTDTDNSDFVVFSNPTKGRGNNDATCEVPGDEAPCCEFTGSEAQQFVQMYITGQAHGITGSQAQQIVQKYITGQNIC